MALPQGPNQRWSLDFVSDAFGCGRRFRILCVVDDFTRECLGLVRDTSLSGARVAREHDKIAAIRGKKLAAGLQYHPAAFETGRPHLRRDRRSTGMGARERHTVTASLPQPVRVCCV